MNNSLGEIAALLTALCWTITAMAFETAGKRVGALSLNLIRLLIGLVFLAVYNLIASGQAVPVATPYQWFWLSISGLVGFVLGDLFLFRSFILVGARVAMVIMSLVPPITALIGWIILGERLNWMEILGMTVTLAGILMVMFSKMERGKATVHKAQRLGPLLTGGLLALGGAVGQAVGLVLSKKGMAGTEGMEDMNAFSASQIRIMVGVAGFAVVLTVFKRWKRFLGAFRDRRAMGTMTLGSFTGPFLGVSLSLMAVKYTETGVAATLMALTPVMLIPADFLIRKERIRIMEIIGILVSVGGVALFFI